MSDADEASGGYLEMDGQSGGWRREGGWGGRNAVPMICTVEGRESELSG